MFDRKKILSGIQERYPLYEWDLFTLNTGEEDPKCEIWGLRAGHKESGMCYMQTFSTLGAIGFIDGPETFVYLTAECINSKMHEKVNR